MKTHRGLKTRPAIITLYVVLLLTVGLLARVNQNQTSATITSKERLDISFSIDFKANELLRQSDRNGLPHPRYGELHYRVSKFQLSPGYTLPFKFAVHDANKIELNEARHHNSTIICPLRSDNGHNPHFAQWAFPCWSVLQRFPNAQRFIELSGTRRAYLKSLWISDMLRVFETAGIKVLDKGEKATSNPSTPEWRVKISPHSGTTKVHKNSSTPEWRVTTTSDSSWQQNHENFQFKQGCTSYFLNQTDVQSLQKHLLGNDFIVRSGGNAKSCLPLRVLLVKRKGFSREWIHLNETAHQIKATWGTYVEVKILPNPEGSLKNQALEFHNADIVISPHGAQLTNLAFIRPCTSVLELFPVHYYLGFFQSYVLSAGGASYDGYPFGRSPFYDTKETFGDGDGQHKHRFQVRGKPMIASPDSILRAFPRLLLSTLSCRRALA